MTISNMNCEALDAALPDFLEGTLDDSRRSSVEEHLRECVRCMGLVRDMERIRKEALALPDLVPDRDLWTGIDARIAAPVLSLAAPHERPRRGVPAWMGIAAAALVVSTAGVTYLLTARSLAPGSVATATGNGAQSSPTAAFASQNTEPLAGNTEMIYAKEISALETIVKTRKTELDSSTVAIIERNLEIIDAAIERSKAALRRDPASLMLSDQLTRVLDTKVELLRTAALLPASS